MVDVTGFIEENRNVFIGLGALLIVGGAAILFNSVIDIPEFTMFSQVMGSGAITAERLDGPNFLKTVGAGTDKIEFEGTFENTGDIKDEYQISARLGNGASSDVQFSIVTSSGSTTERVNAGDVESGILSESHVLEPGQSEDYTAVIDFLEEPSDGDTLQMNLRLQAGGNTVDTVDKEINVQSGGGTITLTGASIAMMLTGFLMMLVAL